MSEEEKPVTYSLLMSFGDQSKSFCHGWECGKLWEKMDRAEPLDHITVHSANAEQIRMIAKHFDYKIELEPFAPALDPDGTYLDLFGAPGPKIQ